MRHKRRRRLRHQRAKRWETVRMLSGIGIRFRRVHHVTMIYREAILGHFVLEGTPGVVHVNVVYVDETWRALRDGDGNVVQLAGRYPLAKPYGDP